MDALSKLQLLSQNTNMDVVCEGGGQPIICRESYGELPIHHAKMPNGKTSRLLKTMLTSACERNCYYCVFRAGSNAHRATFTAEELAKTFMLAYRAKAVDGLFLSSGLVRGGVTTQDRLIDTADILRHKLGFRGYIHLKIMPGAEHDQVVRAMQLGSRVSINVEAPSSQRLQMLAPKKVFAEELVQPLKWVNEIRHQLPPSGSWNKRWPSSATQFVVGAVGESDLELIQTSEYLLKNVNLRRIYYSRFNPIPDTPLENTPAADPLREHRLYQASYLLRDYGFVLEDMPFNQQGNLPLKIDPKLAWARQHLLHQPVELNRAGPETLIKIPGIGPKGVEIILQARKQTRLRDIRQLQKLGVVTKRAAPFVLLDGKQQAYQLSLL